MMTLLLMVACFFAGGDVTDFNGYVEAVAEASCACAPDEDNWYPYDGDEEECAKQVEQDLRPVHPAEPCADRDEWKACMDAVEEALDECDPDAIYDEWDDCDPAVLFQTCDD